MLSLIKVQEVSYRIQYLQSKLKTQSWYSSLCSFPLSLTKHIIIPVEMKVNLVFNFHAIENTNDRYWIINKYIS